MTSVSGPEDADVTGWVRARAAEDTAAADPAMTGGPGMVPFDVFVAARLDEDEATAAACRVGTWYIADAFAYALTDLGAPIDGATEPTPELNADGAHAARHSPARVLAQVAAHRRIVDAYRAARSPIQRAALGVALKAIAGIWDDHPDTDPTWRL